MSPSEKLDDDILRSLQEMITRTDEKIKSILEKHEHFTKTNEKFDHKNDEIKKEIVDLKVQICALSEKIKYIGGYWDKLFDGIWKLILTIIGTAILWLLGFQSSPN